MQNCDNNVLIVGLIFMEYLEVNMCSLSLVGCNATQEARICCISSIVEHDSDIRQNPETLLDQCEQSCSVRYLPDIILACTVAIDTFAGEDPAVHHTGCGLDSDIKFGKK